MCYIQRAFSLPAASGLAWWRQTVSLFMDPLLIRFFYYKIALPAASGFAWWRQTVSLFMDPILIRFFYYKIALNGFSKFSMTQLLVRWAPSYVREWAHMLGPKSITFKNNREKRREGGKNTSTKILSTNQCCFICGPIELKFGKEVWNSSNYNLNSGNQILSPGTSVTAHEQ